MGKRFLAALGALLVSATHPVQADPSAPTGELVAQDANPALEALEARYLSEFSRFAPVDATLIGDHRHDGELDDLSSNGRDARLGWDKEMLDAVQHIDRARLSRDHRVDAALLANQLNYDIWQITESKHWQWDPLLYNDLAGDGVFNVMARDFAPLRQRLKSATARLAGLPRLYEQERANLVVSRVPHIYAEQAIARNRGLLELVADFLSPNLDVLSGTDREQLLIAIEKAKAANAEQQTWLETVVLPLGKGEFRVGRALFDEQLRFVLQSPMGRTEIRRRALVELESVRREMYQIAGVVLASRSRAVSVPKQPTPDELQRVIETALEFAASDHPPRDKFLESARIALRKATEFVRDRALVTLPTDPVEVFPTPVFMRTPSPASCENPGPLDAGQKTFYDVSPIPADWSAEKAESFLREYNTRGIEELTFHEAMPGHYVQFAAANRYASKFRGLFESGSFVEGWAVYAERMTVEAGFDGGDPLMKLVNRKTYLRSVVNALIDQGVQAGDMTRETAMRLLTHDAFQEEAEAAAKWERAQLSATQLSTYFVGVQEHFALRREAERRWGTKFNLKDYNDRVISYGSIPVRFVRALMFDLPIEP
jgi:uncharacterized protein (DUF885 family)